MPPSRPLRFNFIPMASIISDKRSSLFTLHFNRCDFHKFIIFLRKNCGTMSGQQAVDQSWIDSLLFFPGEWVVYKLWEFEGYHQNIFKVEAGFTKQDSGFRLEYRLSGPLDQLIIPDKAPTSSFRDELWKHTCFEAFFQDSKSQAYWELNFSPSREWAIYRFKNYRERIEADISKFILVIQQERYPGEVVIKVDIKPTGIVAVGRVGLSCVLEHSTEAKSYWALRHSEEKPDFHASESFILSV